MPELPEVESVASSLRKKTIGLEVVSLSFVHPKNILCGTKTLQNAIIGSKITGIGRKGKFLLFDFGEYTVLSHLRMEGKYRLRQEDEPTDPYEIFAYHFSNGTKLCYIDVRRFGTIELAKTNELDQVKSLSKLGKEPFEADVNEFYSGLKKHKGPIKLALLDQTLVSGIGNIYADETLFRSKIHPKTPASKIRLDEARRILENASDILKEAIEYGGSTIHSFSIEDGVEGGFQNHLKVYGHAHESCPNCATPLTKIKCGGRGTTFCPVCQKPNGVPFVLGITGPIHAGKSTASAFFKGKGYLVFNADEEVKKLYKRKDVLAALKEVVGKKAVIKNKINAPYLREVFAKSPKLNSAWGKQLDPFLIENLKSLLATNPSKVILDVPLLFSSALSSFCDASILIYASASIRELRLLNEGKDAAAMMALNAHYPIEIAKEKATFIIENDSSVADLQQKLAKLPF